MVASMYETSLAYVPYSSISSSSLDSTPSKVTYLDVESEDEYTTLPT